MRQVVVYPGEDGWWVAECPSLPGCISQGETKEKAIENAKEAIQGYISALKDDNLAIPEDKFDALLVAAKEPKFKYFSCCIAEYFNLNFAVYFAQKVIHFFHDIIFHKVFVAVSTLPDR